MTNDEADAHIHGILELAQRLPNGFDVGADGMLALGFASQDINSLVSRLTAERLAEVDFGNVIRLTASGMAIARDSGGYKGHRRQEARKTAWASVKDWSSAWGSLMGGLAGAAGFFLSFYTYWRTAQDTQKSEAATMTLSRRLTALEQSQKATQNEVLRRHIPLPAAKDTSHYRPSDELTKSGKKSFTAPKASVRKTGK